MGKCRQEQITHALGTLISWLETWKTGEGGYNGFVIHRGDTKRMRHIHDTAWTQAAMIRGYTNLARKSPEDRWLSALREVAELQYKRYDRNTGKYVFAGHEDDQFCSLVHCALANCALLDVLPFLEEDRQSCYIDAVRSNVERYWMPVLWVEEEGAFRFSEIDYYSLHEHRFVINFNTMAAECLLKLHNMTGNIAYKNTALQVGQWLIKKCAHARKFYEHERDNPSGKRTIPPGGLPYQYTSTQQNPDNCVCLYAGLALRGIAELYRHTNDARYARIAEETLDFLVAMRDPATHLFFHTTCKEHIEPYPQFVAGAGMTLVGIDEACQVLDRSCNVDDTVHSILERQYSNGGIPSFIGKNMYGKRNSGGAVWEDVVASVNWNAQMFEYLTRIIDEPSNIQITVPSPRTVKINRNFLYLDLDRITVIFSWWPIRSMGVYAMKKQSDNAIAIDPVSLYARIKIFLKQNHR